MREANSMVLTRLNGNRDKIQEFIKQRDQFQASTCLYYEYRSYLDKMI